MAVNLDRLRAASGGAPASEQDSSVHMCSGHIKLLAPLTESLRGAGEAIEEDDAARLRYMRYQPLTASEAWLLSFHCNGAHIAVVVGFLCGYHRALGGPMLASCNGFGGTGTGGALATLLGRFQMSLRTAVLTLGDATRLGRLCSESLTWPEDPRLFDTFVSVLDGPAVEVELPLLRHSSSSGGSTDGDASEGGRAAGDRQGSTDEVCLGSTGACGSEEEPVWLRALRGGGVRVVRLTYKQRSAKAIGTDELAPGAGNEELVPGVLGSAISSDVPRLKTSEDVPETNVHLFDGPSMWAGSSPSLAATHDGLMLQHADEIWDFLDVKKLLSVEVWCVEPGSDGADSKGGTEHPPPFRVSCTLSASKRVRHLRVCIWVSSNWDDSPPEAGAALRRWGESAWVEIESQVVPLYFG